MKYALLFFVTLLPYLTHSQNNPGDVLFTKKLGHNIGNVGSIPISSKFGIGICNIGDINNDGIQDIAIGAIDAYTQGAVYILKMDSNGTAKSTTILKNNTNGISNLSNNFGHCLCSMGDINNDGIPDIAVGESACSIGGISTGAIHIITLDSNGVATSQKSINKSTGYQNGGLPLYIGGRFGNSIDTIGDLNNDGIVDLAVGASTDSQTGSSAGAAYILFMDSAYNVGSYYKIVNNVNNFNNAIATDDRFGSGLTCIEDYNNDGINDIAVGSNNSPAGSVQNGSVHIICLDTNGTIKTFNIINKNNLTPSITTSNFGNDIALIDDIYGDGRKDLLVADYRHNYDTGGAILINLDSNNAISGYKVYKKPEIPSVAGSIRLATGIANLGDYNNDGNIDIALGAFYENANRGAVYIASIKSQFTTVINTKDNPCYGDSIGTASATVYGNSLVYNYQWSTGDTTQSISNLSAGNYTLTITDENNKKNIKNFSIGEPNPHNVFTSSNSVICIGSSTTLAATTSGNQGASTYHWSNGLPSTSTHTVSPNSTTTYTLYAVDTNNCYTDTAEIEVIVNPLPIVSFSSLSDVCNNDFPSTLSGGLPLGGTYTGTGVNNNIFDPASAGSGAHTITYTYVDNNNCSNSSNQSITVKPNPQASLNTTWNLCNNDSVVTLTGGLPLGGSYFGQFVFNGQFDPSTLPSGIYTIYYAYQASNGCTDTTTALSNVFSSPIPNAGTDQIITTGNSATLVGSATGGTGSLNYSWQPSTLVNSPNSPSTTTSILNSSQSFTLNVTDSQSGCNNTDTVIITTTTNPLSASIFPTTISICEGDSQVVFGSANGGNGVYSYQWLAANSSNILSTQQSPTLSPTTNTNYTLYVISNSDTALANIQIQVVSNSNVGLGSDTLICDSQPFTLDAGANQASYLWSDGSTTQTVTVDPSALPSGINNYIVNANAGMTCATSDTILITISQKPYINLGYDDTICSHESKLLDAGFGFTNYLWENGFNNQTHLIDSLSYGLGTHPVWVEVTESFGCKARDTVLITIEYCNGIRNILENSRISVYPNPTSEYVIIEWKNVEIENIKVINILGKTHYSRKVYNQQKQSIDLSMFSKGVYTIVLESEQKSYIKKLIIK